MVTQEVAQAHGPNLYELAEAWKFLLDADGEGEFTEALDQIGGQLTAKAGAILMAVRTLEWQSELFEAEAKRIAARGKAKANRAEWLRNWLRLAMEAGDIKTIDVGTFTATLQNSPPKCEVVDERLVPDEYRIVVPATSRVSASAIIAHFKASGEQVPGAVVSSGVHLRVR